MLSLMWRGSYNGDDTSLDLNRLFSHHARASSWTFGIFTCSLWITRLTNGSLADESKHPGIYAAV